MATAKQRPRAAAPAGRLTRRGHKLARLIGQRRIRRDKQLLAHLMRELQRELRRPRQTFGRAREWWQRRRSPYEVNGRRFRTADEANRYASRHHSGRTAPLMGGGDGGRAPGELGRSYHEYRNRVPAGRGARRARRRDARARYRDEGDSRRQARIRARRDHPGHPARAWGATRRGAGRARGRYQRAMEKPLTRAEHRKQFADAARAAGRTPRQARREAARMVPGPFRAHMRRNFARARRAPAAPRQGTARAPRVTVTMRGRHGAPRARRARTPRLVRPSGRAGR